jgi:hypothetical protein
MRACAGEDEFGFMGWAPPVGRKYTTLQLSIEVSRDRGVCQVVSYSERTAGGLI